MTTTAPQTGDTRLTFDYPELGGYWTIYQTGRHYSGPKEDS